MNLWFSWFPCLHSGRTWVHPRFYWGSCYSILSVICMSCPFSFSHCVVCPSSIYGVYISQLIRYAWASSNYSDFLKRHLHLRNRLLEQGYKKIRLIRSLKQFIFRYQDLVEIYSVSAEKIINDGFSYSEHV